MTQQKMLEDVAGLLMQRVNAPEMDIYRAAREIIDMVETDTREACAIAAVTPDLNDTGPSETYGDGRRAAARAIKSRAEQRADEVKSALLEIRGK